jgi:hypothetical protein
MLCHGQGGRDCGARRDRLEEFCALDAPALNRRARQQSKPLQPLGQQQYPRDYGRPREMTRERRMIGRNAERYRRLLGRNRGDAHLSASP